MTATLDRAQLSPLGSISKYAAISMKELRKNFATSGNWTLASRVRVFDTNRSAKPSLARVDKSKKNVSTYNNKFTIIF